jgi:hypothetical protein
LPCGRWGKFEANLKSIENVSNVSNIASRHHVAVFLKG